MASGLSAAKMLGLLLPSRPKRVQIGICYLGMVTTGLFGGVNLLVREGLPIVDGVYLNGHGPFRFLVDTGTDGNLIETNLAASIGLRATFRKELATAAGMTVVPGAAGVELLLDSAQSKGQEFLFMHLDAIHARWPDVQGVLGQWFLSRFDYVLDLRRKRLEFGKQDSIGTRVRFAVINGRPALSTSLGDLVLDSGANRLVLFGIDPSVDSSFRGELQTMAGSQQTGMVYGRSLVIDGRRIWRGDALAMQSRAEPGVDGVLPLSVFKAVYVCNSEGYLVFR